MNRPENESLGQRNEGVKMSKVVLITGCSTGIGCDLAQRLARAGYMVAATARDVEAMEGLEAALKLALDVTRPESIQKAVDSTIEQFGRIDVLVNNAGYSQIGALEELADSQVQQMYDVNVFGVLRMVRAVVPYMRAQKIGQIINISSIAGKMATPVNGAYSSTKFALEALSDALRLELAPFNIQVILVEPGAIKTNFDQTVHARGDALLSNPASPYLPLYRKYQRVSDGMRQQEPGPEAVSKVVQQAMETSKPKARYLAGVAFPGRMVIYMRDLIWNPVVRQMFKVKPQE
jgi:NAD(P)-dependent dehydrogenase (short-subunit alcohol dehydrogenase family)